MPRTTTLPPFFVRPPKQPIPPSEPAVEPLVPVDPKTNATLWAPSKTKRPRPRFISTQQLVADTMRLLEKLPPDLSAVIGVARSGMLPASVLATALHLPLFALDQERGHVRDLGHGWRMRDHHRKQGPVLVIDDTTGSGRSLRMTKQALGRCSGCPFRIQHKLLASVYVNPESQLKPDLWAEDLHLPHILEWNMFNSIVTSVSAFDLDGIICHDADSGGTPGTPFHLPRREPVHIITGRSHRTRAETLAWLDHWGVKVASLKMGAWEKVPDWEEIADYKAEAVRRFAATAHERPFGPPMYVESCPRQAERIAELSGVLTVCPMSQTVVEQFGPRTGNDDLVLPSTSSKLSRAGSDDR